VLASYEQRLQLLRLHVKRPSAETRQSVLTSSYRSVYMFTNHSRVTTLRETSAVQACVQNVVWNLKTCVPV